MATVMMAHRARLLVSLSQIIILAGVTAEYYWGLLSNDRRYESEYLILIRSVVTAALMKLSGFCNPQLTVYYSVH